MSEMPWMIYGAYGYTGRLIADLAKTAGVTPVLAGRNPEPLAAMAKELGFDMLTLGLDDGDRLAAALREFRLVLHCAGPFSSTAEPMLDACLASGCNYLDITGEISVFEAAHARDDQAREAGIVVCPGVGFDVVPTDSIAARLAQALPDANRLALGFDSRSTLSPGTTKTSLEGLAKGGCVRRGGQLQRVPLAWRSRNIDFGNGEKSAVTIPWGDVATAFYTTGIPDIEVYIPVPPKHASRLRRLNHLRWLLAFDPVQKLMKRRVEKSVRGPDPGMREKYKSFVWGEARNAAGDKRVARLVTANGYTLTAHAALGIAGHVLAHAPDGGYYTPSRLVGSDFVTRLPGSGPISIE